MNVSAAMTRRPIAVAGDASLDEAMALMDEERLRHLPVVRDARVAGVISERDLLAATGWLHPREREALEAPSGAVADHMHSPAICIGPDDSLLRAVLRLVGRGIGCLPVVDDGDLLGILTETDPLRALAARQARGAPDSGIAVAAFLSPEPLYVAPATLLTDAHVLMTRHHFRHLPVEHAGELVGILSERDVLGALGRGEIEGMVASDVLAPDVVTIGPDEPLERAIELLLEAHVSLLPVLDGKRPIGIATLPDVMGACVEALGRPA
jgi:CBS domain-containing protein